MDCTDLKKLFHSVSGKCRRKGNIPSFLILFQVHVAIYLELNKSPDVSSPLDSPIYLPSRYPQAISPNDNCDDINPSGVFEKAKKSKRRRMHVRLSISRAAKQLFDSNSISTYDISSIPDPGTSLSKNSQSMNMLPALSTERLSTTNASLFSHSAVNGNSSELFGSKHVSVHDIFGSIGLVYAASNQFWEVCFAPCLSEFPNIDAKHSIRTLRKAFSKVSSSFISIQFSLNQLKRRHQLV